MFLVLSGGYRLPCDARQAGDDPTEETVMPVIWAGKTLSTDEELRVRDIVAMFARMVAAGNSEAAWQAESWRRFLPEERHRWTANELEFGANIGPWVFFGAQVGGDPA
jgi:hypothetical protein